MEWKITYWAELKILYIKSRGILTATNANEMIKEIANAMEQNQCKKQIVDHSETDIQLSVIEYYQRPSINEKIGVSRSWKIAMVFKILDQNSEFMETVFRNRGYNFRRFGTLEEAKAWLCVG
ncbi:MAG: hypothetical protein U0Z26_13185 [Anaerolineales bacterium]